MGDINVNVNTNIYNNNMGDNNNNQDMDLEGIFVPQMGYIANAENGLYLTDTNGTVTQENLDEGNANQIWMFERTESGSYFILNRASGNAVSIDENSDMIITRRNSGSTMQQWRIRVNFITNPFIAGRQFQNVFSGMAIDNPEGSTEVGTIMVQYPRKPIQPTNQLYMIIPYNQ